MFTIKNYILEGFCVLNGGSHITTYNRMLTRIYCHKTIIIHGRTVANFTSD